MSIDVPSPGDPILDTWGESVANAINDQHDPLGWVVPPVGLSSTSGGASATTAAAGSPNAGAKLVAFALSGGLALDSYRFQNWDSAAMAAEFALYRDNGSSTWPRVTGSEATWSGTPGGGALNTAALTSGAILLTPGHYWLAIRNTHATNALSFARQVTSVVNHGAYASIPALGAALDVSGFTANTDILLAWLTGEVAGGGAF